SLGLRTERAHVRDREQVAHALAAAREEHITGKAETRGERAGLSEQSTLARQNECRVRHRLTHAARRAKEGRLVFHRVVDVCDERDEPPAAREPQRFERLVARKSRCDAREVEAVVDGEDLARGHATFDQLGAHGLCVRDDRVRERADGATLEALARGRAEDAALAARRDSRRRARQRRAYHAEDVRVEAVRVYDAATFAPEPTREAPELPRGVRVVEASQRVLLYLA